MTKILSIVNGSGDGSAKKPTRRITYIEALQAHLDTLTDEQRDSEVSSLFITGDTSQGTVYSVLAGDSVLEMLGVIEAAKMFLLMESV